MYNKKDFTNLIEKLWQSSEKFFTLPNRKKKHSLKEIFRTVIYVNKTGCQWRMLPCEVTHAVNEYDGKKAFDFIKTLK